MTGINCEVIEDLLPLYVEHMVSESSRKLVSEHILTCEACRGKMENMQEEVKLPEDKDIRTLKRISDKLYRNKVMAVVMTICLMLVISVVAVSNLLAPIRLSYEDVKDYIYIHPYADDSGRVEVYLCCPCSEVEISYGIDASDAKYAQITFYTNKWMMLHYNKNYSRTILLENPEWEGNIAPDKIYYSPQANGDALCIYQAKNFYPTSECYYRELPRQVLNYYLIIIGGQAVLGSVVCILLRKKGRAFYLALKVTSLPVMYVLASFIIMHDKGDIYNAAYYFTSILLVAILLSVVCWWGIGFWQRKKKLF